MITFAKVDISITKFMPIRRRNEIKINTECFYDNAFYLLHMGVEDVL